MRLALQWRLPDEVYRAAVPHLERLGELAATVMPPLAERAERNPPRHVTFEPWGVGSTASRWMTAGWN
ncbi:hypothetical protein HML84_14525 [Alcanivorax sp. IO_7]|nr:hypothetical protein HML84_14525 [Alcanivorax sp. IO_7]